MYLFFTFQFMFLVIIVKQDMHNQVTKCMQLRKICSYDCLHNVMTIRTLLLTQYLWVIIMACNFLVRQNLLCTCLCVFVHV